MVERETLCRQINSLKEVISGTQAVRFRFRHLLFVTLQNLLLFL